MVVNMESVYIWRGGLRHWENCGDGVIATPDGAFLGSRPKADRLRLVDADIYSGATMLKLARALRAEGYRAISFAGSPARGASLPDCVEPLPILLSRKCAKVRTFLFLPRRVLPSYLTGVTFPTTAGMVPDVAPPLLVGLATGRAVSVASRFRFSAALRSRSWCAPH